MQVSGRAVPKGTNKRGRSPASLMRPSDTKRRYAARAMLVVRTSGIHADTHFRCTGPPVAAERGNDCRADCALQALIVSPTPSKLLGLPLPLRMCC